MSRPLRIEYNDAWYHVMNRGRRSEDIFFTDQDYIDFIKVLKEASALWNLRISAYCLMPNHYHLLVQTPDSNISRCMRHINGVYTQRFNREHDKEGQLFRGRYKAILIDADNYLLEVMRYIHRNPLKARLVNALGDYRWSSHRGYLSRSKKWAWLEKDSILFQLNEVKVKQQAAYFDFVSMDEPQNIGDFYSLKNVPSILGCSFFKNHIREKFSNQTNTIEIPESKILALDAENVTSYVCEYYNISRDVLFTSRRGSTNHIRDFAIYLVRQLCCLTLPEIGKVFKINNYSTVSSAIQRVKRRTSVDKNQQKELDHIVEEISKSQKRT
ncbi:MAG: transposase [Desulfotalea sp.]